MDVMRAEAEVSKRAQDLTVAEPAFNCRRSLIKNALTKSLDDPVLEAMPVVPTDHDAEPVRLQPVQAGAGPDRRSAADRPELAESDIDLENRQISRQALRATRCCHRCHWWLSTAARDWRAL